MRWSAILLIDNGVQYPILLLDHVKIIDGMNSLLFKKEWSVDFLRGQSAPYILFRAGSFEFVYDMWILCSLNEGMRVLSATHMECGFIREHPSF